jgi:hypothetical protein
LIRDRGGRTDWVTTSDRAANYSYTLDNLGRVTSETQDLANFTPNIVLDYTWDANNNRLSMAAEIELVHHHTPGTSATAPPALSQSTGGRGMYTKVCHCRAARQWEARNDPRPPTSRQRLVAGHCPA